MIYEIYESFVNKPFEGSHLFSLEKGLLPVLLLQSPVFSSVHCHVLLAVV